MARLRPTVPSRKNKRGGPLGNPLEMEGFSGKIINQWLISMYHLVI
jgi:hypothetical protein